MLNLGEALPLLNDPQLDLVWRVVLHPLGPVHTSLPSMPLNGRLVCASIKEAVHLYLSHIRQHAATEIAHLAQSCCQLLREHGWPRTHESTEGPLLRACWKLGLPPL